MKRDNTSAMRELAERYSQELNSQIDTLSFFTPHGPENGRVHEQYLRAVLRRFLPATLQLGTGFAASSVSTSRQCDILVFDQETPLLFQAGEVAVVDLESLHGVIEVKTGYSVNEDEFGKDFDKLLAIRRDHRERPEGDLNRGSRRVFTALCGVGQRGMTLPTFRKKFHAWVRNLRANNLPERGTIETSGHPDVVYVRGRYMLLRAENDGAYHILPLEGANQRSEGDALLGLAVWFYRSFRMSPYHRPWWINGWEDLVDLASLELLPWEEV